MAATALRPRVFVQRASGEQAILTRQLQVADYLIFDVFGISSGASSDPVFEGLSPPLLELWRSLFADVILFITASSVHIYAGPDALAKIFPLIRFQRGSLRRIANPSKRNV